MIAAGNDSLYRRLCTTLGRPELGQDARFLTNGDRVVNRGVLVPMIEEITATWDLEELMAALDGAGIPNAPLQNVAQVTAHAQTEAVGILQKGPEGALPTVGLPLAFDGARSSYNRVPPELGEHNEAVLGTGKAL
jgi:crotonobetainyl-CoA:carnitine CoA-transferase CaiB-like acyl-CoA transferase